MCFFSEKFATCRAGTPYHSREIQFSSQNFIFVLMSAIQFKERLVNNSIFCTVNIWHTTLKEKKMQLWMVWRATWFSSIFVGLHLSFILIQLWKHLYRIRGDVPGDPEVGGCRPRVLIFTPSFYRVRGDVSGDPEAAGCRQGIFTWIQTQYLVSQQHISGNRRQPAETPISRSQTPQVSWDQVSRSGRLLFKVTFHSKYKKRF